MVEVVRVSEDLPSSRVGAVGSARRRWTAGFTRRRAGRRGRGKEATGSGVGGVNEEASAIEWRGPRGGDGAAGSATRSRRLQAKMRGSASAREEERAERGNVVRSRGGRRLNA